MITLELGNDINIDNVGFEIYNIIGEQMPINGTQNSNTTFLFNLEGYSRGIYFLRLQYGDKVVTRKISLIN